jgi:hypothetical protein
MSRLNIPCGGSDDPLNRQSGAIGLSIKNIDGQTLHRSWSLDMARHIQILKMRLSELTPQVV